MIILVLGILLLIYGVIAKKYSVLAGMFFVFLIMGFQEGVPGDYQEYQHLFEGGGASAGDITVKEGEFSYIWLTQALSGVVSYHFFVFFTSFLQCLVIGFMIKSYSNNSYHYFGVLLVYFCFFIMMIQMKAMRQGYAVDTLLLAYWFLGKRKIVLSIITMIISYGFHNSIIIATPFYVAILLLILLKGKEKAVETPLNKKNSNAITMGNMVTASMIAIGIFLFYFIKF